jgi:hypothetical protein
MTQLQQGFATGGMGFRVSLRRNAPEPLMSALGHKRTFRRAPPMSALTAKANIAQRSGHSMTSSASESRLSDILIPSALAVFKLITIKNFVACMIGKSAGLAPLRTRPA